MFASSYFNQDNGCNWYQSLAQTGASPEDWERYLILDQVEQGRLDSQSDRFRMAYADLIEQLHTESLLQAQRLTEIGQRWKQSFESQFLLKKAG